MRTILLASAALLGFAAGPLMAQPATPGGSTAGMPGSTGPGSTGMVPGTGAMPSTGGSMGAGGTTDGGTMGSGTGMTGMRPMRGQVRQAAGQRRAVPAAQRGRMMQASQRGGAARGGHSAPASMAQDNGVDVPRTGDYRGGAGSPSSMSASNTSSRDTRSEIAPRLPDPAAGGNSPQAYLAAAQRALAANRTGAAQEALERAETRLLSRSTDPSMANTPDPSSAVQAIGAARRAIGARDMAGARSAISAAMSGMGG